MKKLYVLLFTILISTVSFGQTTVFINEIHYDNINMDINEGVEITGPAGTNLSTYTISAYNGATGNVYDTLSLSGSIPDEDGSGFGSVWFAIPLQNGPDGVALDNNGAFIQFLSYEGSFMATNGPANAVTSTDIGVSQNFETEWGKSLQLISSGNTYEEFTWAGPLWESKGNTNAGQTLTLDNAPSVTLFDGPPDGAIFIADPETPLSQNLDITFVTSHFDMSSDAGGGTGSGGEGFIKWSVVNTDGNVTVSGGNVFTSNTGLIDDYITGIAVGETYIFRAELVDNAGISFGSPIVYSFTVGIATYTDVANLAELRTQTVDSDLYYRVTGSVINIHSIPDYGLTMYFQDGTAGIMVNDYDYYTGGVQYR